MTVLAAIDIGSISVRLLVARFEMGKLNPLYQDLKITRLGEGVGKSHRLDSLAIDRTMKVLKSFQDISDNFHADTLLAVATSAVRDSENGPDFLERVKGETRIDLKIIEGKEEAALTFGGAYSGLGINDPIMLIDIGGGSTEIICGNMDKCTYVNSIDVGAVRMTEAFLVNDPVKKAEYEKMQMVIKAILTNAHVKNEGECQLLVGVGGTVTSMAAIAQGLEKYDSKKVHLCRIEKEKIDEIVLDLVSKTNDDRRKIKGLQPERADIILAGAAILQQVMDIFNWNHIIVSESDILDGIILNHLGLISYDGLDIL